MAFFVGNSAIGLKPDDDIPLMPFYLDSKTQSEPSEFEAIFVAEGVRYQYGFVADRHKVFEEWLYAAPEGRNQTWLERSITDTDDEYEWKIGSYLKGQRQSVRSSTRPNALFLSTGAQLNNPQLLIVWTWFSDHLRSFFGDSPISEGYTNKICAEDSERKKRVLRFMQDAAIELSDLRVERERSAEKRSVSTKDADPIEGSAEEGSAASLPLFSHTIHDSGEDIEFPIFLESAGTQFVYAWSGPLIDVLDRGLVLALDELDSSLHTHLASHLIGLFHSKKSNQKCAQLIFTTHNPAIMGDRGLLRRDQVWFVFKDQSSGTRLQAFTDFEPRKGEDRERNYLRGRYGAIPNIAEIGNAK